MTDHLLRLLERMHGVVQRLLRIMPLLSAFLLGVVVNSVSDPDSTDLGDVLAGLYDVTRRPVAWFNIAVTALVCLVPPLHYALRAITGTNAQAVRVSRVVRSRVPDALREVSRGRMCWGPDIVLQSCPRIGEGWRPADVTVALDPTSFRFRTPAEQNAFAEWAARTPEPLTQRGNKFRLMENPTSFTDEPSLTLRVQEETYAQSLFLNRITARDPGERLRLTREALDGRIDFPNLLCLHATVATRDGWVLLTHRSHKVAYDPATWSCSLEEQLSEDDFGGTGADVAERWVRRALREELGLSEAEAAAAQSRFLAVFLETDKLNTGLAALVTVDLGRRELDAIIGARPRADYEFQDWDFVRWPDLAAELARPSRPYHPSSGLRMLLAGTVREGVFGFSHRLDAELRRG